MKVPICPLCRGWLDVQECTTVETYHPGYHVAGRQLPTRERATVAAFCSGCEFVIDLQHSDGSAKSPARMAVDIRRFQ